MVARWQCPKAWLPDDMINPDVHVCTCATIYHKILNFLVPLVELKLVLQIQEEQCSSSFSSYCA